MFASEVGAASALEQEWPWASPPITEIVLLQAVSDWCPDFLIYLMERHSGVWCCLLLRNADEDAVY